ncbi:hypothetical protein E2562_034011 [Oryza meyeriana var. granulata]|uniref:DUF834 domain-containing protein n=1 Tax=Oryza meyeriana var. granulata TaxID=110450 RepID=A0A6G1ESB7_9ORYZ|nr:hypothetical protein E2562_034011 [Oryza meyeriana var. granulata]
MVVVLELTSGAGETDDDGSLEQGTLGSSVGHRVGRLGCWAAWQTHRARATPCRDGTARRAALDGVGDGGRSQAAAASSMGSKRGSGAGQQEETAAQGAKPGGSMTAEAGDGVAMAGWRGGAGDGGRSQAAVALGERGEMREGSSGELVKGTGRRNRSRGGEFGVGLGTI